jgi:hypothetical protein
MLSRHASAVPRAFLEASCRATSKALNASKLPLNPPSVTADKPYLTHFRLTKALQPLDELEAQSDLTSGCGQCV